MMSTKHTNLVVSSAPHIIDATDTGSIMRDVVIALMPALAWAVYIFGYRALVMTAVCVAACVIFEGVTRKVLGKPQTLDDWSAVVTGVILAFNLPVSMPYWMAIIGCLVAIVVVKQLFGGLGENFANPAIVGRIVLVVGFATYMNSWTVTNRMSLAVRQATADAVTGATPLVLLANGEELPSNLEMFLGFRNGSMGEISALALLIGGIYLIFRKVISPAIPVSFLGTVAILSAVMGFDPVFMLCAGGVMLGAIFMATDYVTSPVTTKGKIIFGIGCGALTMAIRAYGAYPEGVSFAILLMNILTPHIDNWTRVHIHGVEKGGAKK